jgi:hypothetical protein
MDSKPLILKNISLWRRISTIKRISWEERKSGNISIIRKSFPPKWGLVQGHIRKFVLKARFWIFERDKDDEQKARKRSQSATLRTFCEIGRSRSRKVKIAAKTNFRMCPQVLEPDPSYTAN